MSKKNTRPPKLKLPEGAPAPVSNPDIDKSLEVRLVDHKDFESLLINVVTIVALFIVSSITLSFWSTERLATTGIPLALVSIFVIYFAEAMWTTVDSRQIKIYLDYLRPGKMIAYSQGFHFTAWSSSLQEDPISIQKEEIITTPLGSPYQITFSTMNAYRMYANITVIYARRGDIESLSKSLKYRKIDLDKWIIASLAAKISDLGGRNSCESCLYFKGEIVNWVSRIFDDEDVRSHFERQIGCEIKNPRLEEFYLTPESEEIFQKKAKIEIINKGIKSLLEDNPTLDPTEAARIAQAAEGAATREIKTLEYEGIPEGATFVALGESGMGVATTRR